MIKVFTFDVYDFLDPGASLSFVTPYIAMRFGIVPEQLLEPFVVSTHVGESIIAERVNRDCSVSVNHKGTMVDLVKLDMVDIGVILGVAIGMVKVFTFDVYDLLNPGASLSFVTPYVAMRFDIVPEQILGPFS
ncbi:hypothetical protein H5410_061203 [Solanum commersonii]|uniref:Uncharacterized protein n=1 Tax=Solanum commersonii TaxID=4109 RepID=A0A9J5W741_SOLCO|nr:hypothetical protein H5410_061203 [Solanum commersonii]